MLTTPPLSLYVHFPWCIRKCPYCDFNSHTLKTDLPEAAYIDALCADLKVELPKIKDRPLISIFMGGGTPSLFSADAIQRLLEMIRESCEVSEKVEITLEANPGAFEYERFAGFYSAGINRLSIGVQSFQDEKLKILGRVHHANAALKAAKTARAVGFDNFNLDIMHGLPQQSLEDGLYDLQTALSLKPTHFSWYQLTLEPHTRFAAQPPVLPEAELIWELQTHGHRLLRQAGFEQYEISAYSQASFICQHNQNYWEFGDYLGIGAGAHSKITQVDSQTVTRSWKKKSPQDYLKGSSFICEEKVVPKKELPFEFMLNRLRLYREMPISLFEQRTGLPWSQLEKPLLQACEQGLLIEKQGSIQLTDLGRRFYNDLVILFIDIDIL